MKKATDVTQDRAPAPHFVPLEGDEPALLSMPERDGIADATLAAEHVSPWRAPLLWFRRGLWGITDQAFFAISNFVLNIALARLLIPADYGTFALAYSTFLLLGTIYTSLYIEPLLVFGAGKYREDLPAYVRALVRFHWAGSAIASGALAIVGVLAYAIGHAGLGATLVALAISSPWILLQWLMRRVCYVRFEPRYAAHAGLLYVVVMLAGGYVVYRQGLLTAASSIALMGAGSAVSAAWIMWRLRINPFDARRSAAMRALVSEHWSYGRWVIGGSILGWVPQSIYYFLLPVRGGLESTAVLKALMNLIMPVIHAYQPMMILMVPALVQERGSVAFTRTVRLALALSVLCSCVYWILLGVFGPPILDWLYHGRYLDHAGLLWIIGLVPITGAAIAVLGSALRALQRPNHIFLAYAMSTLVAVSVGTTLMLTWHVTGAAIGLALSSLTTMVAMAWSLLSSTRARARREAGA